MIFSTMTVYFRDTTKFLSYVLRIWLYLSPVLYPVSAMVEKYDKVWPPLGKDHDLREPARAPRWA